MLSRHVVGHPRSCGWQASAVVVLAAEHAGPHLYELRLVEVTVVVRVKHVDEVARHRLVEAGDVRGSGPSIDWAKLGRVGSGQVGLGWV